MKALKFQLRMMEMDIQKIFSGKLGNPILNLHLIKTIINQVLGLGIFIGKTLLERNKAKVICRNSKTRLGAEVIISWKNTFLKNI